MRGCMANLGPDRYSPRGNNSLRGLLNERRKPRSLTYVTPDGKPVVIPRDPYQDDKRAKPSK